MNLKKRQTGEEKQRKIWEEEKKRLREVCKQRKKEKSREKRDTKQSKESKEEKAREKLSNQRLEATNKSGTFQADSKNNSELRGNGSNENIGFGSVMVTRFTPGVAHVSFEMVDGTLNGGSDFVKLAPLFGIALDAGKQTKIQIFIGVGSSAEFSGRTRVFTETKG